MFQPSAKNWPGHWSEHWGGNVELRRCAASNFSTP